MLNSALENQNPYGLKSLEEVQQHFSESLKSDEKTSSCKSEKIQQGSTSIYVFEGQSDCTDDVQSFVGNVANQQGEKSNYKMIKDEDCAKNSRGSTSEPAGSDETVIVVRKRGNKVFIEI